LPIRWRLTLFIALAIGMILLALGLTLYLLNRNALLKSIEETTENGAKAVADTIEAGETLSSADDDDDQLILDEVGVIIRDKDGGILQREGLQAVSSADDNVWRKALKKRRPSVVRPCSPEITTTTSSPCRWIHRTVPSR
jgi:two-component system, OmpR family, sensor kinase